MTDLDTVDEQLPAGCMAVVQHSHADWHSHEPNMVAELRADRRTPDSTDPDSRQRRQPADMEHGQRAFHAGMDRERSSSVAHSVWAHSSRWAGPGPKRPEHWPPVGTGVADWSAACRSS